MAPAAAPDERVLVLVPVFGGALDGLLDLGPGIEAPPFNRAYLISRLSYRVQELVILPH